VNTPRDLAEATFEALHECGCKCLYLFIDKEGVCMWSTSGIAHCSAFTLVGTYTRDTSPEIIEGDIRAMT